MPFANQILQMLIQINQQKRFSKKYRTIIDLDVRFIGKTQLQM
jgi:hypothetical protein